MYIYIYYQLFHRFVFPTFSRWMQLGPAHPTHPSRHALVIWILDHVSGWSVNTVSQDVVRSPAPLKLRKTPNAIAFQFDMDGCHNHCNCLYVVVMNNKDYVYKQDIKHQVFLKRLCHQHAWRINFDSSDCKFARVDRTMSKQFCSKRSLVASNRRKRLTCIESFWDTKEKLQGPWSRREGTFLDRLVRMEVYGHGGDPVCLGNATNLGDAIL